MNWQAVCKTEEVAEGKPCIVNVGKREVGIILFHGKYHAVLNFCPHAGAPLALGHVEGTVRADEGPGGKSYVDNDSPVIRCPWHHWEFDLKTGGSPCQIKTKTKVFGVKVEDGQVWVEA